MAARPPLSLKGRALQWLSQREHSRIELRRKLMRAARLRDEAAALLEEYKKRRKQAEADAQDILEAAKRDAETMTADAKAKTEE